MFKIVINKRDKVIVTKRCSSEKIALGFINSSEISRWNKDPRLNKWTFEDLTTEILGDETLEKQEKLDIVNEEIASVEKQIESEEANIQRIQSNLTQLNNDLTDLEKDKSDIEKEGIGIIG